MAKVKVDKRILKMTPRELGPLSFGEIALVLGVKEYEAKNIFESAVRKLKINSRELHEYSNMDIGDGYDKLKTRF